MCKSKDIKEHEEVRNQLADSALYRLHGLNEVENGVHAVDLETIVGKT
jgi:hypothetical protein